MTSIPHEQDVISRGEEENPSSLVQNFLFRRNMYQYTSSEGNIAVLLPDEGNIETATLPSSGEILLHVSG